MRTRKFYLAIIIPSILTGCAPYQEVSDVIYMQNADIQAPIIQMPAFVNINDENSTLVVRPRVFMGYTENSEGKTGSQYTAIGTTRQSSNNYQLKSSSFNIGLDADLLISRVFGLSGGYNFSTIDNINLNGGFAGINLRSFENVSGIRFDAGIAWQQSDYDVQSVIVRTTTDWDGDNETKTIFCRDKGQQTNWSYYFNLNFTYDDPTALMGGFFNLGYIQQQILEIEPYDYDYDYYEENGIFYPYIGSYQQTDLRNEISTGFFSLNGGLSLNLMSWVKLMGGAKFYIELNNQKVIEQVPVPFIQMQFRI